MDDLYACIDDNVVSYDQNEKCKHESFTMVDNTNVCSLCGVINNDDTVQSQPVYIPSIPVNLRKPSTSTRNIFADIYHLGFSSTIAHASNDMYIHVTDGKIFRGKSRRSIIFACVFHTFKEYKSPQSFERFITVFGIDRKSALKGMKTVDRYFTTKSLSELRTPDIITEILTRLEASNTQKTDILLMFDTIQNKSSMLNRSRPGSVAAGLIYYYIIKTRPNDPINIKMFATEVDLSELTIKKIAKEIEKIVAKL